MIRVIEKPVSEPDTRMDIPFNHIQAAHCENGVTTALLRHHGLDFMTEPLAFGIGSGLFYIHVPFMKFNKGPALSFRTMPGSIFKKTCRSLGISVVSKKRRDKRRGKELLDEMLDRGVPVGCQVGVFHLPYFPARYRFHFNAHNIIVFGREGDLYHVSDPVMETVTTMTAQDLEKARYARGPLAPNGHLYYPENVGEVTPARLRSGMISGMQWTVRNMLRIPLFFAGVKGIRYTSRQVRKWREKLGPRDAALYLGQVVRMQEEIGTGGGGFRFVYGAFLESAAKELQEDRLIPVSEQITRAGDLWRDSAVQMAGIYKGRLNSQKDFEDAADILTEVYEAEKAAFQALAKINFKK